MFVKMFYEKTMVSDIFLLRLYLQAISSCLKLFSLFYSYITFLLCFLLSNVLSDALPPFPVRAVCPVGDAQ